MTVISIHPIVQIINGEEFVEITQMATCDKIREKSYFISQEGKVFSAISNRFLNPTTDANGYLVLNLQLNDGTARTFYVHRIVMITFQGNINYNGLEVNHKDGEKSHSYSENLEWTTSKGNTDHAYKNGLLCIGEDCPWSILTENQVRDICLRLQNNDYNTITEIANEYHVSVTTIGDIARGKRWRHITKDYGISYEPRIKFTDEQVHFMCKIFSENKDKSFNYSYYMIIFSLGLEDTSLIRKRISKIRRKDPNNFAYITSLYDY